MESYFMTDEYVERRRAYVNEIRRTTDHSEICRADMKNLFDQIMKHAPVDQKDPETVAADQLCKKMFRLCFHINLFHEKKNSHRIKYHKRACGCDPDLPDSWNLLGYALL